MKKTNIAKRIVSVLLAMSIVLSFALVSVSAAAPKGATVVAGRTKTNSFETGRMFTSAAPKDHYALSSEVVRTGSNSVKIQTKDETAVYNSTTDLNTAVYYINTNGSWYPYECNPNYYYCVTMYAYTTGSADISLHTYNGSQQGEAFHISGGTWQEVSWVFKTLGSNLFYIAVNNAVGSDVYFDDFEFVEISAVADVEMTFDKSVFDYAAGDAAYAEYTSTVDLASAEVTTAPEEGVTAKASVNKDKLTIDLEGAELGAEYSIGVTVVDAFKRTSEEIALTVAMPKEGSEPMEVVDWSIADGATNVLAPVNYVYLDAPKAINNDTLEAADFTIEGIGASVTGATLVDADTIKVTLDGVLPAETYTLSVDNVANAAGGILSGSITFTTVDGVNGPFVLNGNKTIYQGFENMEYDEEKGTYIIPNTFSGSQAASVQPLVVADKAHSGTYSIASYKNTSHDYYGGATGFWINHTPRNKEYIVSFWYYSDTWTPNGPNATGGFEIVDTERGTLVGDVHYSSTTKSQWNKVTFRYIPTTVDAMLIGMRDVGANDSCVYFDDFTVQEVGSIAQPVIIAADGSYDDAISAGAKVEIPVAADVAADAIKVFVVQYGENNKMISATSYTNAGSGAAISFTVPDTANKTKVIIMNATTYAPLCDAYAMNY